MNFLKNILARKRLLCVIVYALSVAWLLLFGAVSVSTGELKPRGIFVDENALNVKFSTDGPRHLSQVLAEPAVCQQWDCACLCSPYIDGLIMCTDHCHNSYPCVVELSISPPSNMITQEATVFAFLLNGESPELWIQDYVLSLSRIISESAWTTKSVIILLVPSSKVNSGASPALERWIGAYHAASDVRAGSRPLLRSAFVVDLGSGSPSANIPSSIHWRGHIVVLAPGLNGQLPNMDMLANLRAIQQINIFFSKYDFTLPVLLQRSNKQLKAYAQRMLGLLKFSLALFSGPSGLHHLFLAKNIDSVSILLGEPFFDKGQPKYDDGLTAGDLTEFLMRVLRSDHLLHGKDYILTSSCFCTLLYIHLVLIEELHHSFFFYLLMGPNHFVVRVLFFLPSRSRNLYTCYSYRVCPNIVRG